MSESWDSSKEFANFSETFECPLSDDPMSRRWSTQFDVFYSYLHDSDIMGTIPNLELRSKILEKNYSQIFEVKTKFAA
jgi:hypothetical protein